MIGGRLVDKSYSHWEYDDNLKKTENKHKISPDKWHCIFESSTLGFSNYDIFKMCYIAEVNHSCLHCQGVSTVVPVIYGFPSKHLIDQYRNKKIQMGGDYLLENTAAYMCLKCEVQFYSYPYSCCEIVA